jgi:general L-amino acid transport system substrate-binding protein
VLSNAGEVLDRVKAQGTIKVGVTVGMTGFSYTDEKGNWNGFIVDCMRAVAAALFKDANKVTCISNPPGGHFNACVTGETDVVGSMTWTYGRDVGMGVRFVDVHFWTGQGFMVPKKLGIKSEKELDGITACTVAGTTSEVNIADFFRKSNMKYNIVTFKDAPAMIEGYDKGRCDLLSLDHATLVAFKFRMTVPDDHNILPYMISREPWGSYVSNKDPEWLSLVRWSLIAQIRAEELGVNSKNVDEMLKSSNPEIQRLLGVGTDLGKQMGVSADWAYQIIKQVGNYGEMYNRNVGPGTKLNIPRGLNDLWTNGGLIVGTHIR